MRGSHREPLSVRASRRQAVLTGLCRVSNRANAKAAAAAPIPKAIFFTRSIRQAGAEAAFTCSGRTPTPITRPMTRWIPGICTATFNCQGAFAGPGFREISSKFLCASACNPCVTRVGNSRRIWTDARSASVTRCSRNGSASSLAAATASWIARLMPTPPTGDIACAASPIHKSPGRYH